MGSDEQSQAMRRRVNYLKGYLQGTLDAMK